MKYAAVVQQVTVPSDLQRSPSSFLALVPPNAGAYIVEKGVGNARRRAKTQCDLFSTVNKGHLGSITPTERSAEEISLDVIVQIDLNYSTDC